MTETALITVDSATTAITLLASGRAKPRDIAGALERMPDGEAKLVLAELPAASQVAIVSASIRGSDTAPHLLLLDVPNAARAVLYDTALFHVAELLEEYLDPVFVGFVLAAYDEEHLEVDEDLWLDFIERLGSLDLIALARDEALKGMQAIEADLIDRHTGALRAMFVLPENVIAIAKEAERTADDLLGDLLS